MRIWIIVLSFFIFLSSEIYSQEENTYSTKERLFYVERSKNKNIVCYDVNLDLEGNWQKSNPVKVYWVNREANPGKTNGLSVIQKKLAYGYKLHYHKGDSCVITLNACPDKNISIVKKGNTYHCSTIIDKQWSNLNKVFVQANKGNSLSVDFIELYGTNMETGESISERVNK